MFVITNDIRAAVPSSEKAKVTKFEKWLNGIPLDTKAPVPVVFLIAAGISESDALWVVRNVKSSPGDVEKLTKALRAAASESESKKLVGKKVLSAYDIVSTFSKKELEKAALEFAKKDVATDGASTEGSAATETPAAPASDVEIPNTETSNDGEKSKNDSVLIDPTDRAALFLAILNFTGKPAEIVDAFLVPKEDVKVDNAPVGADAAAPTATPVFEAASTAVPVNETESASEVKTDDTTT